MKPCNVVFHLCAGDDPALRITVDGKDATPEQLNALAIIMNGDLLSGFLSEALREAAKNKKGNP